MPFVLIEWPEILGPTSEIALEEYLLAMIVSLAASIATYALYSHLLQRLAARSRNSSRGVPARRTAITTALHRHSWSLPLSLGLLGALLIRPISPTDKGPGRDWLPLVVIASRSRATYNYELIGILFVAVALVLVGQRIFSGTGLGGLGAGSRDLIITMPASDYTEHEAALLQFLKANLKGFKTASMTQSGGTASLHASFRSSRHGDEWGAFRTQLEASVTPASVDLYVG